MLAAIGLAVVPAFSGAFTAASSSTVTVSASVSTTDPTTSSGSTTTGTTVGDSFTPANGAVTVAVGGTASATATAHLDALPPKGDILLAFDTTGSMGGQPLTDAKNDASSIVSTIQGDFSNSGGSVNFALAHFDDYLGHFSDGTETDTPYTLDLPLTGQASTIISALGGIPPGDGGDLAESYFRTFYEASVFAWEPGAERFLVVLGDQTGHDGKQQTSFADCPNSLADPTPAEGTADATLDPGSSASGPLSASGSIADLVNAHVTLSIIHFATEFGVAKACHDELAAATGGTSVLGGAATDLPTQIEALITTAAKHIDSISARVVNVDGGVPAGGTADPASWVHVTGLPDGAQTAPLDDSLQETVQAPSDAQPGTYTVDVQVIADGAVRSTQHLTITVATPISNVALSATPSTLGAGIDQVKLADIGAGWLSFQAGSTASSPVGSTPVGSTPVGSTPVGSTPVGSTPVGSTPVGSTPVGSTPVGSTPVGSTGLFDAPVGSTPVGSTALSSILLSQIQLNGASWEQILCPSLANKPLQSLTLLDLETSTETCIDGKTSLDHFKALSFRQADLSTTLFRSVHWSTLVLGNTPLSSIPVPGGFSGWCTAPNPALPSFGGSCNGIDDSSSVLLADISGQLGSAPVGSTPVGSTPVGSTPVGSTPVGSTAITSSKLATIPLSALGTSRDTLINCSGFSCDGKTLGDAYAAGALRPTTKFDDIAAAMASSGITVNDVLVAILGATGMPWEQLSIQGLQPFSATKPRVTYTASATVDCSIAPSFGFRVTLPDGFFPVPASESLSLNGAAQPRPAGPAIVTLRSLATNTYQWTLACGTVASSANVAFTFDSFVALNLGKAVASTLATAASFITTTPATAAVSVAQNGEPNDSADSATSIKPDTLVAGHIAFSGDQDDYQLSLTQADGSPLPRGTKVSVFLKVPTGTDLDLTVSKPSSPSFFSTPVGSTPVGSTPIEDRGVGFSTNGLSLPSETLQDVPVGSTPVGSTPVGSTPVGSTSTTRGAANEAASIISDGTGGVATIGVTGYNGASSSDPYVLRVQETPPPALPAACPARSFPNGAPTSFTTPSLPASLPTGTKTLFVVDTQQLSGLYGSAAVSALLTKIGDQSTSGSFAARSEIAGSVLKVDGNQAVRDAYGAWNTKPCDPALANNVVRTINDVVATYRTSATGLPNLHYIVLLGTDEAIPMARTFDPVTLSPEENEAADLAFTTNGLTSGNALYNSAAGNNIVTDGAYGAFLSIPWLGHDLLLPQLSISRLVESPSDMQGQIGQYLVASGYTNTPQTGVGTLAPSSDLVAGYDFLADGAKGVYDNLKATFGLSTTAAALTFGSGNGTIYDNLNVAGGITGSAWTGPDASTALAATNPPSIISLNAHYNHYELQAANNALVTSAAGTASNVLSRILFTMGCHAGLNVADTLVPPANLNSKYLDWAQQWASRKTAVYIANTGFGYGDTASVALSERLLSLYAKNLRSDSGSVGEEWAQTLSQYFATAGAYDVYDEKVMEETTFYGLPFWHFAGAPSTPAATSLTTSADPITGTQSATIAFPGSNATSSTQFGLYRPNLPLASQDVSSTLPAHGVWIKSLATNDVTTAAKIGYPTIDLKAHEPAPAIQPIFFPASPFTLEHSLVFGRERDYVNVSSQYRPGGGANPSVQRNITGASLEIFYGNAGNTTPPLISQVLVSSAPNALVQARVSDDGGAVAEVAALVNDGTWHYLQLTRSSADPTLWTGTVVVTRDPEVFVEATDGQNVAYSANKGSNFTSTSTTATGPQILLQAPAGPYAINQAVNATYQCIVNGSPLPASQCVGSAVNGSPIDTHTFGTHTFLVRALDASNNLLGSLQRTYVVQYMFKGFFSPVDNEPTLNTVNSGQAIPVKFSLSGNQGLNIFADGYPKSQQTACDASAPADGIETTLTAGNSSLSYDAGSDQYNYVWKTEKAWVNSCRALILKLKDGSTHRADFKFTK